jgi:hypothetical protein
MRLKEARNRITVVASPKRIEPLLAQWGAAADARTCTRDALRRLPQTRRRSRR